MKNVNGIKRAEYLVARAIPVDIPHNK